jgi:hypothetical protein
MSDRSAAAILVSCCLTLGLTSCSGGQSMPADLQAKTPSNLGGTSSPSPSATEPGYVIGATFFFQGTSVSQDTYYDGTSAQNLTGTSTTSGTELNHEDVLGNASFDGLIGLYDIREYVSAVGDTTYSQVFDNYERIVPTSTTGADLEYVGDTYSYQVSANDLISSSLKNATPQVIDVLPHASGASYSESPQSSYTTTETSPEIGTVATTIETNADGSYARFDNATYPGGSYEQNWKFNSNFSGSHTVTYGGAAYPAAEDTIAVPTGGTISVVHATGSGTVAPSPAAPVVIADWYPVASGATPVLYTQTHQNEGAVSLPSTCAVPGAAGSASVWDIRTIVNYFDIWGDDTASGTYSTETQDEYVSDSYGELCITDSTTISAYSTATGYLVGRYVSTGAIALQNSQLPTGSTAAVAPAPLRADTLQRLRVTAVRFVRRLTARSGRPAGHPA